MGSWPVYGADDGDRILPGSRDGEEHIDGLLREGKRCCWKKTTEKLVAIEGAVVDGGWWDACLGVITLSSKGRGWPPANWGVKFADSGVQEGALPPKDCLHSFSFTIQQLFQRNAVMTTTVILTLANFC